MFHNKQVLIFELLSSLILLKIYFIIMFIRDNPNWNLSFELSIKSNAALL
jgi:hypothetical protein